MGFSKYNRTQYCAKSVWRPGCSGTKIQINLNLLEVTSKIHVLGLVSLPQLWQEFKYRYVHCLGVLEQKDYCRIHSVIYKLSVLRGVLTVLLRRVHIAETELNRTEHVLNYCELPVSIVQLCSGDVNPSLVTVSDVE